MKLSEAWLREWVNPKEDNVALCRLLTMSGLEVEESIPVSGQLANIIVGQITKIEKHPESERLRICEVNIHKNEPLMIVSGAKNIALNQKVAIAKIGAILANGESINASTIRGIASHGMICSSAELGLTEKSEGILVLPADAPIGEDILNYMDLKDHIIDIAITPNRGDCLSIRGLAREIAALTKAAIDYKTFRDIANATSKALPISLKQPNACPIYCGRVIREVNSNANTPLWLQERLRRSGIRTINPIVDVTNYVMLELGQPMHAFDLDKIDNEINVRFGKTNETLLLLDGSESTLNPETLIIADKNKALAIAGVMGGMDSSVTLLTKNIFLESAYFDPTVVAKARQSYGLNTDSAYRFERGVDPTIQREAIARATQLIIEIAGGEAGQLIDERMVNAIPTKQPIKLLTDQVSKVLGVNLSHQEIEKYLQALNFKYDNKDSKTFIIDVPAHRFDLKLAEDVIEDIARMYGYDRIPTHPLTGLLQTRATEGLSIDNDIRKNMQYLGYQEVITYSFIQKELQQLVDPLKNPYPLTNPITNDMAVMRTNLWGGLLNTLLYNLNRQQQRIRIFEIGTCFINQSQQLTQPTIMAGLVAGLRNKEQWGFNNQLVDFYDLKGDVESLLQSFSQDNNISFRGEIHPALHPGQSAAIFINDKQIGWIGMLHPSILQSLNMTLKSYVFELDTSVFLNSTSQAVQEISKFPEIRRDLSLIIKHTIPVNDISDTIKSVVGDWLKDVFVFDVFDGKNVPTGFKSVAIALILQHSNRTLVDEEVVALIERVLHTLKKEFEVELRS